MFSTTKRNDMPSTNDAVAATGKGAVATVIAYGVKVEGDFASEGDVVIEGEVQGVIKVAGLLTVGSQARLKADVSAAQAVIAGSIEGNIKMQKHLDLKATAKVVGDISCETVSVESGARLNGKLLVGSGPADEKVAKQSGASSR